MKKSLPCVILLLIIEAGASGDYPFGKNKDGGNPVLFFERRTEWDL